MIPTWKDAVNLPAESVKRLQQTQRANWDAFRRSAELMMDAYIRFWGGATAPEKQADKRFQDDAWRENPAFSMLKQAYLNTAQWLLDLADTWQDIDPDLHHRIKFWTRQYADAISPTNFPLINPEVIQEIVRTGGANLARGMENLMADLQRGRISQVVPDAFKVGKDLACTPGKVVFRNKLIELIQYTPVTGQAYAVPILVIPPWINKYYVMDLSPGNSMFKYLVESGFTVFAISWKNPDSALAGLDWEDFMTLGPLAALEAVKSIVQTGQVNMAGYCLGGIMLQTTLAYMAAIGDNTAKTATYFATHQDFKDAGDIVAFISEPEVRFLSLLMDLSGGYLDGRNMAATFNMLRANDLFWHYIINNYMLGRQPPEFDLLYWNSDSTRVPKTIHMTLLRDFFMDDKLGQPGGLVLKGVAIDTRRITTPTYTVATIDDHIVPWRGAFQMRHRIAAPMRLILGESGHIAGIINHPARKKRGYWVNEEMGSQNEAEFDPDAWYAGATHHEGSWWVDWVPWLAGQSGDRIMLPSMGNDAYPPLMDAPGEYVLEM